ncbi:hypothetical protein STANM309S_03599 [Streptomyces tanashiensis]
MVNPFFHTFGYKAGILACLMRGAVIVPQSVFTVDTVLANIAAERITVLPRPAHPPPVPPGPPGPPRARASPPSGSS